MVLLLGRKIKLRITRVMCSPFQSSLSPSLSLVCVFVCLCVLNVLWVPACVLYHRQLHQSLAFINNLPVFEFLWLHLFTHLFSFFLSSCLFLLFLVFRHFHLLSLLSVPLLSSFHILFHSLSFNNHTLFFICHISLPLPLFCFHLFYGCFLVIFGLVEF